jgi:uncharacterized membrane protein
MSKGRLEAFSDGVLAIIITIMVLDLKAPRQAELSALRPLIPAFLSYALSFVFVGIYWNNHHHLLQATRHVNGRVLWANLHLLFWLSLTPFATSWMGETSFGAWPVAAYGIVLLLSGVAFYILSHVLIAQHGEDSALARDGQRLQGQTVAADLCVGYSARVRRSSSGLRAVRAGCGHLAGPRPPD